MNLATFATRIKELADGEYYTVGYEFKEDPASGQTEYEWIGYIHGRGYRRGPNPLSVIAQFKPCEAPTE